MNDGLRFRLMLRTQSFVRPRTQMTLTSIPKAPFNIPGVSRVPVRCKAEAQGYQCNKRRPRSAPAAVGINIPSTYQTARNGACVSGQWMA